MRTYFVSDLHLFARRSFADRHLHALYERIATADRLILGGDIFDFRWSHHACARRTTEAAIHWLDWLLTKYPQCKIEFVLGNHDFHPLFREHIRQLSEERSNFAWHPYYLRIGKSVFLHGDVADRRMPHHELTRRRHGAHMEPDPHPRKEMLYEAALHLRLHRLVNLTVHTRRRVAKRVLYYLNDIGQGPESGVRHVYFGHTHKEMSEFHYRGVTFDNGGAPLRGLRFRIVAIDDQRLQ